MIFIYNPQTRFKKLNETFIMLVLTAFSEGPTVLLGKSFGLRGLIMFTISN